MSTILERKSSIDSEPLTLDFHQIQIAREAALSIMNTRTVEEALKVFMEGLKPMVGEKEGTLLVDYSEEENYYPSRDFRHKPLPLICTAPRDVATAPF